MKKLHLSFVTVLLLSALPSCTPGQPMGHDDGVIPRYLPQSLYELGMDISDGDVDIFDPWLMALEVPEKEMLPEHELANFPLHSTMMVSDADVQVYTLDTKPDAFTKLIDTVAPPVPLVEEEFLLP